MATGESIPDVNESAEAALDETVPVTTAHVMALTPVVAPERIASIDVIRGFALLGILAMNIVSFGLPTAAYEKPSIAGGFTGANFAVWLFCHLFFEDKMMSLFSMLFGAGLVLMSARAEDSGKSPVKIYYRRVLWLLLLGLFHAYFIWLGDILYSYAACGLWLYLFRHRSPRTLIILGVLFLLISVPLTIGLGRYLRSAEQAYERANSDPKAEKSLSADEQAKVELWREVRAFMGPTKDDVDKEIAIYRGSYWGIVRNRAGEVFAFQTWFFVLDTVWSVGGRMLIGMGLMKLGVFSGLRSTRFYILMALVGYGVGLPVVAYGAWRLIACDFDSFQGLEGLGFYNGFASIVVALGHAAAIILILKAGLVPSLTRRLAAVGRMALTNYLFHSIVCTTLFYGYGFGLFARLDRVQLFGVVIVIWIFQLLVSPIWLEHFRFGPAEWVWRSLTYWKRQPMLVHARAS
jgi:uncharacterized protein